MTRPAANAPGPPRLRPYQREAAGAILRAARGHEGAPISVQIARQGGKNELSAQVGVMLLVRHADQARTAVKCAPTFRPQAQISIQRLWQRLRVHGLAAWASKDGNRVRLGGASQIRRQNSSAGARSRDCWTVPATPNDAESRIETARSRRSS